MPPLHNKISTLLRSHPYPSFNSQSPSQKSTTISMLHEYASQLSGQDPRLLYNYLLFDSHVGKRLFPNLLPDTKITQILNNIKIMHDNTDLKYKSSILILNCQFI